MYEAEIIVRLYLHRVIFGLISIRPVVPHISCGWTTQIDERNVLSPT